MCPTMNGRTSSRLPFPCSPCVINVCCSFVLKRIKGVYIHLIHGGLDVIQGQNMDCDVSH